MFNIFKSKKKNKTAPITTPIMIVSFKDLSLQNIFLEIRPNSNETLLAIGDDKNKNEILLDREQSLLLATILQEYALKGGFSDLNNKLKEDE